MKIFKYLKSMIVDNLWHESSQENTILPQPTDVHKQSDPPKTSDSKEMFVPLLTVSQAAKKNGVTRQAIFFAIKMKRLNAKKENDTWLITETDLKDYFEHKYCRSKSRKEGELIFDKNKGFYSIGEAAKLLNQNTNHIYYLVRMGKLKTHRQGSAIVIHHAELHQYIEFVKGKSKKNAGAM